VKQLKVITAILSENEVGCINHLQCKVAFLFKVLAFSSTYDFVLTSGGIGPTHDDLTVEGVARAFDEKVVPHPSLVELCEK